ncbi:MAG: hypothetical protein LBU14_04105 [Candidatus Peribacteria bacterium]|nr:hypothetical protein [Candidatus Peribacteria bacterium]
MFTDFSLNHSKSKISSFFSVILKTSTIFWIIHSFKNNSTCFSPNQSILKPCFPTAKINFSMY